MIQYIDHHQAKTMMDEQNVVVIDVREQEEFDEVHIPNSHLVALSQFEQNMRTKAFTNEACFLVYCRSGRRSKEAALLMESMGYKNVYEFGGIIDWPYDVVSKNDSESTYF